MSIAAIIILCVVVYLVSVKISLRLHAIYAKDNTAVFQFSQTVCIIPGFNTLFIFTFVFTEVLFFIIRLLSYFFK